MILERIRNPEIWRLAIRVEDLGIELAGRPDATTLRGQKERRLKVRGSLPNVAVDDLSHANVTTLGHEVEGLSLHTCRLHTNPFQVVFLKLGEGYRLGLIRD